MKYGDFLKSLLKILDYREWLVMGKCSVMQCVGKLQHWMIRRKKAVLVKRLEGTERQSVEMTGMLMGVEI